MTKRIARCACAALQVVLDGDPVRVGICHCHDCQRRAGTPFTVQARFRRDQLVAVAGEARDWRRAGDDGTGVTFHFCGACGSTVFWEPDGLPGFVVVAVGAFADRDFPPPTVSVYDARMHPWVTLPASVVERYD